MNVLCDYSDVSCGQQYCDVPMIDKHTSLCLLLELAVQRGTLNSILDSVLLLLNLWDKATYQDDNRYKNEYQNDILHLLNTINTSTIFFLFTNCKDK